MAGEPTTDAADDGTAPPTGWRIRPASGTDGAVRSDGR
jgi:hypothetical protein